MPPTPSPPIGLTTKLSTAVIAVLALYAAVTLFLNGDHSSETITAIVGGVVTLVGLTGSRGLQAAAILRNPNTDLKTIAAPRKPVGSNTNVSSGTIASSLSSVSASEEFAPVDMNDSVHALTDGSSDIDVSGPRLEDNA